MRLRLPFIAEPDKKDNSLQPRNSSLPKINPGDKISQLQKCLFNKLEKYSKESQLNKSFGEIEQKSHRKLNRSVDIQQPFKDKEDTVVLEGVQQDPKEEKRVKRKRAVSDHISKEESLARNEIQQIQKQQKLNETKLQNILNQIDENTATAILSKVNKLPAAPSKKIPSYLRGRIQALNPLISSQKIYIMSDEQNSSLNPININNEISNEEEKKKSIEKNINLEAERKIKRQFIKKKDVKRVEIDIISLVNKKCEQFDKNQNGFQKVESNLTPLSKNEYQNIAKNTSFTLSDNIIKGQQNKQNNLIREEASTLNIADEKNDEEFVNNMMENEIENKIYPEYSPKYTGVESFDEDDSEESEIEEEEQILFEEFERMTSFTEKKDTEMFSALSCMKETCKDLDKDLVDLRDMLKSMRGNWKTYEEVGADFGDIDQFIDEMKDFKEEVRYEKMPQPVWIQLEKKKE